MLLVWPKYSTIFPAKNHKDCKNINGTQNAKEVCKKRFGTKIKPGRFLRKPTLKFLIYAHLTSVSLQISKQWKHTNQTHTGFYVSGHTILSTRYLPRTKLYGQV